MALVDLTDWLDEYARPGFVWYAKRLSGNDTLANDSHQSGPYIPRDFLFKVLPEINRPDSENPDARFMLAVDSHPDCREVRAVWYNNRNRGGTRNETRLTNFGGGNSALLDPDSTGALAVFVFRTNRPEGQVQECNVWVCDEAVQEDIVENHIGPVEPGKWVIWSPEYSPRTESLFAEDRPRKSCCLEYSEIPAAWTSKFPTGAEMLRKTIELCPSHGIDPDARLVQRRDCEFEMFRSIEEAVELPWIKKGFSSVDEFVARAQTVLQRRKARSGRSLDYMHVISS